MPQLDPSFFLTQLFWLVITFTILYVVLWRIALPKLADILEERQERIDEDLRRAETFKRDAEKALTAYEKTLAEGREQARAVLHQASEHMAEQAAERHDELSKELARQADQAETRIAEACEQAQAGIHDAASDVTKAVVSRLLDADVGQPEADEAVAAVLKERG